MAEQTAALPDLGRTLIIREVGIAVLSEAMQQLNGHDNSGIWTGIANSPWRSEWWSRDESVGDPEEADVVSVHRDNQPRTIVLRHESVFEVRGFNGTHEFRWNHIGEGSGRFVILELADPDPPRHNVDVHQGWELPAAASSWLLWGEHTGSAIEDPLVPGVSWHKLAAARIGSYWVPVPGSQPMGLKDTHLRLNVATVVTHDVHGNVYVTDEILTGFAWGKEAVA